MSATSTTAFSRMGDSVRKLQVEADKVASRVQSRLTDFARSPVKELGNLAGEARRVRKDVRSQVETAVRRIEQRVEKRVYQVVKPVTKYFDIVSREELEELQRRVSVLEKRIHDLGKSAEAA